MSCSLHFHDVILPPVINSNVLPQFMYVLILFVLTKEDAVRICARLNEEATYGIFFFLESSSGGYRIFFEDESGMNLHKAPFRD